MKSFEIQTMREGRWGIDSVFNDRELALFEARRVDENRRYAGVRVIEEIYDEDSGLTTCRTIFRGSKSGAQRRDRRRPPTTKSAGRVAPPGGAGHERAPRARAHVEAPRKRTILLPVLFVLLLLFMGLAALLGLHLLSSKVG